MMYAQFCQSCASVCLFTSSELLLGLALSRGLWGMSEGLDDGFIGLVSNYGVSGPWECTTDENPGPSSPTSGQALPVRKGAWSRLLVILAFRCSPSSEGGFTAELAT